MFRRKSGKDESVRGQGLVEFAILLPVLLLVVLGAVDFGRVMFSWIQITNASREAAAYAAFNPNDSGGITLRANQETNVQQQRGEGTLDIDVTCQRADNGVAVPCSTAFVAGLGSTITVRVSEPFSFFTPLINGLFPGFAIGAESTSFYMVPRMAPARSRLRLLAHAVANSVGLTFR